MKSEAPVEVVKVALDVEEAEVMVEGEEGEVYHNIRYTDYTEYIKCHEIYHNME